MVRQYCFFLVLLFGFHDHAYAQGQRSEIVQSIFFIGDSGEPYISAENYGLTLRKKVNEAGPKSVVVYLGDNVYPAGLPDRSSHRWQQAANTLSTQVGWLKGTGAQGIFIPGNHDWAHWGKNGFRYVLNQQQWIDSLKDNHFQFLPKDGCPGPVEINLDKSSVLVILDTQWFLHQYEKPAEEGSCDVKTQPEVLAALDDILKRNSGKRIIIAGHHPLITYGEHGGVFTFSDHVFPFRAINRKLYIPLPVVGSLYPLYRKFFGHIQDTAHPLYREFSQPILELLKANPSCIYVAGHEHALQFIEKDSSHFIVSGSGAKTTHVRKKKYARFAAGKRGFVQLNILESGEAEAIFFQVGREFPEGKEIYKKKLVRIERNEPGTESSVAGNVSFNVVNVSASGQYHASRFRKKMLGENYRKEWATTLRVPVFDIGKEHGGLKILQKGGGQQTLSLRMEDSSGREYVIRSVEKFPEKAVPQPLRKTFAQDLVQDQISASHPYAALIIPALAEAAGIYHTNPKLVFLPDDRRFGEYRKDFANMLALFEERPAGDWSDASYFGSSKKIVNTEKVLEQLRKDNDNAVDQKFVLRSRLFDMIIGDWDRHDDQWRWATLKNKKGDLYRPIPRDRDQAFFGNEGILPSIWSRKWALPKFEGFRETIRWPSGLSFNARYFDRTFLTQLSRSEWESTARQLQESLSDSAISRAVLQWPEEIQKLHGERIARNLRARRDRLVQYAMDHYEFLAHETEVVGSDKAEHFRVNGNEKGNLTIQVFKIAKDGVGKELYRREFIPSETREVRIFGLGGDDQFTFSGRIPNGVRIRAIGGEGNDVVTDSVTTGSKKIIFYDQIGQFEIARNEHHLTTRSTADASANDYDRKAFRYNRWAPLILGNYNPDDGVFLGGGVLGIVHGFRKEPFKQQHLILASVAPATQSFNFRYQGKFVDVIGKWNIEVDANLKSPNYVNNFFGMGNESVFNASIDEQPGITVKESIHYYRYRFEELRFDLGLSKHLSPSVSLKFGPALQRIEMEKPKGNQDRFIDSYAAAYNPDLFNEYNAFAGGSWDVNFDKRNDTKFTRRGIYWTTSGRSMAAINKGSNSFSAYESSMSLYHSFRAASRLVFAVRVGGGTNTGKYEFFQAQILDGKTELRGFRKTRFYGDQKFYSNFEVRLRLLNFRTYLFPATFGLLAFHDLGRVWYKNDDQIDPSAPTGRSQVWHKSYGGGLWFTPFNLTVLSTEFGHSKEGNLFYVRLGFLF